MKSQVIKCTSCSLTKNKEDFKRDSRKKSGRASICKLCAAAQSQRYYRNNTPEYDASKRRQKVVEAYGITLDDYDTLYQEQDGRCKICKIEEKYVPKQRFHIDHNHETGDVRGLLCAHCNKGLGMFKDNSEFLRAAAQYLEDN